MNPENSQPRQQPAESSQEPSRQLITRTSSGRSGLNALALLRDSARIAQKADVPALITAALSGEGYATRLAGNALAGNEELVACLQNMPTYAGEEDRFSPERDLKTLSTTNLTAINDALMRLCTAFEEARMDLAARLPDDFEAPHGEEEQRILRSFIVVNAGYALVLNTVHLLLLKHPEDDWQDALAPQFEELLKIDPILGQLADPFIRLRESRSEEAKQSSLRVFFHTFCELAAVSGLYDQNFSTLVQSMLLRQLVLLIRQESAKPIEQRKLVGDLVVLFDERLRDELKATAEEVQNDQPVLRSLRRCQQEGRGLFERIEELLIESVDSAEGGRRHLRLSEEVTVGCQVVLSVGCLFAESGIANKLNAILTADSRLNPDLVAVYTVALSFDTLAEFSSGEPYVPLVNTPYLLRRGVEVFPKLKPGIQDRLCADLFSRRALDLLAVLSESEEGSQCWTSLTVENRRKLIDTVLIQLLRKEKAACSMLSDAQEGDLAALFVEHLKISAADSSALPLAAIPWLTAEERFSAFSSDDQEVLLRTALQHMGDLNCIGLGDCDLSRMLLTSAVAGVVVLSDFVAPRQGSITENPRLCSLLAAAIAECPVKDKKSSVLVVSVFSRCLYNPLGQKLVERGMAVAQQKNTTESIYESEIKLHDKRAQAEEAARLARLLPQLQDTDEYAVAADKIDKLSSELQRVRADIAGIKQLDRAQRFRKSDELESLGSEQADIESRLEKLQETRVPVPQEHRQQLMKDFLPYREVLGLEGKEKRLAEEVEKLQTAVTAGRERLKTLDQQVRRTTAEVDRFIRYFEIASRSPAIMALSADQLIFPMNQARLVSSYCTLSLAARRAVGGQQQTAPVMKEERLLHDELSAAFNNPASREDVLLVLRGLTKLLQQGSYLLPWPEIDQDTADREAESVTNLLYRSMMIEAREGLRRLFYERDAGWDESFHGVLLPLFAARGESSGNVVEKGRCATLIACVLPAWVELEKEKLKKIEEDRDLPPDRRRTPLETGIDVTQALQGLTYLLSATKGVIVNSARKTDQERRAVLTQATAAIFEWACDLVKTADDEAFDEIFLPLERVILKGQAQAESLLNDRMAKADVILGPIIKRRDERERANERAAASVADTIPEMPVVRGLDEAMIRTQQIGLPPPDRDGGTRITYQPQTEAGQGLEQEADGEVLDAEFFVKQQD